MPTQTANMNLSVPIIGTDSGLTWEQSVNTNSATIDQHNHTPGQGVLIPPSGLNINAALPFNNQQATGLQATAFTPQSSLSTPQATYVIGSDLYYNNGAGTPIKLTSGTSVNATTSGISSGTATASFVSSVLVVNANTNLPANIQVGSILLGNNSVGSNFLTLSPPNAMAANYGLTLPSLPAAQSFVTLDASGNFAAPIAYAAGITSTNIAAGGVSRPNLVAVGQQISSSCGTFTTSSAFYVSVTNLQVTLVSTGRPVVVALQYDSLGSAESVLSVSGVGSARIQVMRGIGVVGWYSVQSLSGSGFGVPSSSIHVLDPAPSGSHVYQITMNTSASSATLSNAVLCVYEL